MEPAPGETVIFDGNPSWRSTLRIYVLGDLAALAVGALLWVVLSPAVGVLAGLAVSSAVFAVGLVHRRATRYVITDQRLYIRRGILSRHEQQTRVERVQDVSTRQSFGERLLNIGTVDFDTAGDEAEDFRFAGVDDPREVVRAVDAAQRGGDVTV